MPGISITVDGQDLTSQVEGLTFSNADPGGYEASSFTLPGEQRIGLGAPVVVREGLEPAWLGRVAEGGLAVEESGASTTRVTGEGPQGALSDSVMAMIYADTSLEAWRPPDASRRAGLIVLGNDLGDDPRVDDAQAARRLALTLQGPSTALTKIAEAWYDAGPAAAVGYVIAAGQEQATNAPWATAAWNLLISTLTSALAVVGASADFTGFASPVVATIAGSPAARFALAQWYWTGGATLTAGKPYDAYLPGIGVYGPHGLPLSGDALSASNLVLPQGIDPVLIAADAAKRAGLSVGAAPLSGYVNRQAAYKDYVPHRQVVEDQAGLLGWHWGVWAGGSAFDPRPEFRITPPAAEATCQVARGDCSGMDTASRLADLYSIAYGKFEDPALGAGYASSQIDNPALPAGMTRTVGFDAGAGTAATALAIARLRLLLSASSARSAGWVTLPRNVTLPGGGTKPAHLLRAGVDRIRVTGLPGIRDLLAADTRALDTFRIKRVETTVSAAGVPSTRVELDAGADLIEVLTARLANAGG